MATKKFRSVRKPFHSGWYDPSSPSHAHSSLCARPAPSVFHFRVAARLCTAFSGFDWLERQPVTVAEFKPESCGGLWSFSGKCGHPQLKGSPVGAGAACAASEACGAQTLLGSFSWHFSPHRRAAALSARTRSRLRIGAVTSVLPLSFQLGEGSPLAFRSVPGRKGI